MRDTLMWDRVQRHCTVEAIRQLAAAQKQVARAQELALRAESTAERVSPPTNLRPATADDIRVGQVIWYPKSFELYEHEGETIVTPGWQIVERVLYPEDDWKAYESVSGCRYGLRDAYVEVNPGALI